MQPWFKTELELLSLRTKVVRVPSLPIQIFGNVEAAVVQKRVGLKNPDAMVWRIQMLRFGESRAEADLIRCPFVELGLGMEDWDGTVQGADGGTRGADGGTAEKGMEVSRGAGEGMGRRGWADNPENGIFGFGPNESSVRPNLTDLKLASFANFLKRGLCSWVQKPTDSGA